MSNRPTIADIAKAAGVGTATVDRVLNGRAKVREETAQRVYRAACEIGYHGAPLIRENLRARMPEIRFGILLQKENQAFYQSFARHFREAVEKAPGIRGRADVVFARTQNPAEHAEYLGAMGRRNHVIAATSVSHHETAGAVRNLHRRNVPVFALLNDFAPGLRHSYFGLNNIKVGRIAAWAVHGYARAGKVALFVGGSRWHGHELRETGFRSFFRERPARFELLETLVNSEIRDVTYEATLDLLRRYDDLRGLYVAGGGMEGAIEALREMRQPGEVAVVVNELTETSRDALLDGYLTLIVHTPLQELCNALVTAMTDAASKGITGEPRQIFLQPKIYTPESL